MVRGSTFACVRQSDIGNTKSVCRSEKLAGKARAPHHPGSPVGGRGLQIFDGLDGERFCHEGSHMVTGPWYRWVREKPFPARRDRHGISARLPQLPPIHRRCALALRSCWAQVRFIERPFCERLARPSPWISETTGFCRPRQLPIHRFITAPGQSHISRMARCGNGHRLKYNDRVELAKPLGAWMARAGNELLVEADLPCRFHRRRLAARQLNQAHALAQTISARCGVPADPFVLARVKQVHPRSVFRVRSGPLNLQGAFRVTDGMAPQIEGRAVVLIDDVMTSGATATAARRHFCKVAQKCRCLGFRAGRLRFCCLPRTWPRRAPGLAAQYRLAFRRKQAAARPGAGF